jgi:hypothetical protein
MTRLKLSHRTPFSTVVMKPFIRNTLICVFLSMGLAACATAPTTDSAVKNSTPAEATPKFSSASKEYKTRNYSKAVSDFDAIIVAADSSDVERRLAHLGKAMVYLSYDENWHSIKNAQAALGEAARVPSPVGESLNIDTDLLMEAIVALINSQTIYDNIKSETDDSGYQIAQLNKNNKSLEQERDELRKENASLNAALEKLKKLTLGN